MRKIMRTVVIGATLLLSPCVMAGSDGVEGDAANLLI